MCGIVAAAAGSNIVKVLATGLPVGHANPGYLVKFLRLETP